MTPSAAGKGDDYRPVNGTEFRKNYSNIRKECGCEFGTKCGCEKVKIVFAGDLDLCECCEEELYCPIHEMHYADCDCVGPSNAEELGYTLKEIDGVLYGFKGASEASAQYPKQTEP